MGFFARLAQRLGFRNENGRFDLHHEGPDPKQQFGLDVSVERAGDYRG
jgi:hypothetical protein